MSAEFTVGCDKLEKTRLSYSVEYRPACKGPFDHSRGPVPLCLNFAMSKPVIRVSNGRTAASRTVPLARNRCLRKTEDSI